MSRLGINTGSSANDGTGDSLRSAMGKINSNFQELYDTFGDGDDLESYVDSAGISTVAENLTGNPIINTSGAVVAGVATAEHLEVRNITATGVITATQFFGDGSQLENVVATNSGVEILDDSVRKGIAKELNFGNGLTLGDPDGAGRVLISLTTSVVSGGGTVAAGIGSIELRNDNVILGEFSKIDFNENLGVTVAGGIATVTGITTIVDAARLAYYTPLAGVSSLADVAKTLTTDSYVNTTGIITASQFWSNGELVTGSQGTDGTQGPYGFQGVQGLQGTQASQGTQGPYGFQGTQGVQGLQGTQASQGTQGIQGTQGVQGVQGVQGLQGPQGVQGTEGEDGTSVTIVGNIPSNTQGVGATMLTADDTSYVWYPPVAGNGVIADDTGRLWTFGATTWSDVGLIKGPQGATGLQGTTGSQGIQGVQGLQGIQGVQGTTGDTGSQGSQGIQGVQGVQGVQGTQGVQGLQGVQGTQGVQGLQGTQAAQGTQGILGVQGADASDIAAQGVQGIQGIQGVQGTQGILGQDGFQGVQGETGAGFQGLQGTSGSLPGAGGTWAVSDGALAGIFTTGRKVGIGSTRPTVDLSVEGDIQVSGVASVADLKFSTNIIESTSGTLSLRAPSGQYVYFDQNLVYFTSTAGVYYQYGIDVFGNGTASNFRGQLNVGSNGAGFGVTITAGGVEVGGSGIVTASNFNGGIRIEESIDDNVNYNVIMMDNSGAGNSYSKLMVDNGGLRFNPGTNYLYAQNFSGTFHGSGANLTSLDASELTGALPAIDGSALTGINVGAGTSIKDEGDTIRVLANTSGAVVTGVLTATSFSGDGGGLTGVTGAGAGVTVSDSGVSRGTAGTINFGIGLTCSEISAGVVTVTAQGQTGVNTTTASAGVAYTVHSFALSDHASAEYTFTCGLGTQRQVQKLLVMHDGTTAYSQEYAIMYSPNQILSIDAAVVGSNIDVRLTPESGQSGVITSKWNINYTGGI